MTTRWMERVYDQDKAANLARDMDLRPIVARVMAARGIDTREAATAFLGPKLEHLGDPGLLADMPAAAERIVYAVRQGQTIGIFGDYDVDGVTSTTLLWEFLEQVGAKVFATIPDRLKEGYGLSVPGVERLKAAGAQLIITVDCGITAHEEVLAAVQHGIDVIVIDHHTVPVELPKAVAVINPHRVDCSSDAKHLCAVAVTFNLCLAVRRMLREQTYFANCQEPNMRAALDLVALGTVADVMPLVRDNRVFVVHGLAVMARNLRPGIQAMLHAASIDPSKLSAGTLGFHLGPRINAAGRLEDAMQAVHLLRARDFGQALVIAEQLEKKNAERRSLEQAIVQEAIAEVEASADHREAKVLVVGREHWHPGVVGIAASRLVDKFGKPAIVIGEGGKGSGRSIPAFHLHEALCEVKSSLHGFGGHAHAVGVQLGTKSLSSFRDALLAHAHKILRAEDLGRVVLHDGAIPLEEVSDRLVEALSQIAPFGRANPEPVFRLNSVTATSIRELKGAHLRGIVRGAGQDIGFIAFGMATQAALFQKPVDLLAVPEINEWQNRKQLQLRVKEVAETKQ